MPVFAVVKYCNAVLAVININPFMSRNFKLCIVDFVIGFCAAFNVSELNIAQNLVAEVFRISVNTKHFVCFVPADLIFNLYVWTVFRQNNFLF